MEQTKIIFRELRQKTAEMHEAGTLPLHESWYSAYRVPRSFPSYHNPYPKYKSIGHGTYRELENHFPVAEDLVRYPIKELTFFVDNGCKKYVNKEKCESFLETGLYVICPHCGLPTHQGQLGKPVDNPNAEAVCRMCLKELYHLCPECERFFEKPFEVEEFGRSACPECLESEYSGYDSPQDYHVMKNRGIYHFCGDEDRKDTPYLGFELEVDSDWGDDEYDDDEYDCDYDYPFYDINRIAPAFFEFEDDGSLNNGFEAISNPSSIKFLNDHRKAFTEIFRVINNNGFYSSYHSCGFHVHIDRSYFGEKENERDTATAKILYIFEKFWNELVKFSGRSEPERWSSRYREKIKEVLAKEKQNILNRYYAVNLTNKNTIEIRLWAGAENVDDFYAKLNLTAEIAKIAKNCSAKQIHNMTFEDLFNGNEILQNKWTKLNRR